MKVKKAVIPAAGLGTRFLPATKAIPKEMIPIIDKPMIQYIVEEARDSGVEMVVLITSREKAAIEDHFDDFPDLESALEKKNKLDLLESVQKSTKLSYITSVRQGRPLGLGHAVFTANTVVGDEPFGVMLPDDLIDSEIPCLMQLIDIYERYEKSVVAVMEVERQETSKYGIIDGREIASDIYEVRGVVEKPVPDEAKSNLAVVGRYVLAPEVFDILSQIPPGKGGEIQLTDALSELARRGKLSAYKFRGERFDGGDRLGYLKATLNYVIKNPELRRELEPFIRRFFL
ncbi:MAG: UTP--glucose-1-phosphate uridylyltransferase GalU [Ignavibacteriales bacterium]